jgi:hypothetical protein
MTRIGGPARGALVLTIVAAAAACSGADERGAYVDAVAATAGDEVLEDSDRECYAAALVDTIGVETLQDKVSPDDIDANFTPVDHDIELDDAQGGEFYDRLSECFDVRELIIRSLSSGQELPAETVACIDQHIDEALAEKIIVASVTQGDAAANDPEIAAALDTLSADCAPTQGNAGTAAPAEGTGATTTTAGT